MNIKELETELRKQIYRKQKTETTAKNILCIAEQFQKYNIDILHKEYFRHLLLSNNLYEQLLQQNRLLRKYITENDFFRTKKSILLETYAKNLLQNNIANKNRLLRENDKSVFMFCNAHRKMNKIMSAIYNIRTLDTNKINLSLLNVKKTEKQTTRKNHIIHKHNYKQNIAYNNYIDISENNKISSGLWNNSKIKRDELSNKSDDEIKIELDVIKIENEISELDIF